MLGSRTWMTLASRNWYVIEQPSLWKPSHNRKEPPMSLYGTVLVSLVLLLVAFQASVAAKPLLTVTCDAPQGADMSYGGGLFGLRERKVETSSVRYPDLHPTFLIDEDKPQRLLVTFGDPTASQAPPEPDHP